MRPERPIPIWGSVTAAWRDTGAKMRAAPAVARSILVVVYHLIRDGSRFIERGAAFVDQLNGRSTQQWLTRRLERLGFQVILEPLDAAA